MRKRLLGCGMLMLAVCCLLTACDRPGGPASSAVFSAESLGQEESGILDKLCQIEKDWTQEQVFALVGEPDRYGERSVVAEVFYTISPETEACIAFWSDGLRMHLIHHKTRETTILLE